MKKFSYISVHVCVLISLVFFPLIASARHAPPIVTISGKVIKTGTLKLSTRPKVKVACIGGFKKTVIVSSNYRYSISGIPAGRLCTLSVVEPECQSIKPVNYIRLYEPGHVKNRNFKLTCNTQCSDGIDNDGDTYIDKDDFGCQMTPGDSSTYDPTDNDENQKPVITLVGSSVINMRVNRNYVEQESTVNDPEEGDITNKLVIGGDTVNTSIVGTYVVTYNAQDTPGLIADEVTRTVNITSPNYGPYCGDGVVNQSWEKCDSGNNKMIVGCSAQCQYVVPDCYEHVFMKTTLSNVQNKKMDADASTDIYIGGRIIPSGVWEVVMYNGVAVIDTDDINTYENTLDVGVTMQRKATGTITTRHFGSHKNDGTQEHLEGAIEFYGSAATDVGDDSSGNNRMENWGPNMVAQKAINAGKDAAWIDSEVSNFWTTVTVADDSFFTYWNPIPVCEDPEENITVIHTKVVCEDEQYLPNWGAGSSNISSTTVEDFLGVVNAEKTRCWTESWPAQWAPNGVTKPSDNSGEQGDPWTTFTGTTQIDLSELSSTERKGIWVREVWNDQYVPFSGANTTEDVSAETYCSGDVYKYDNYDKIVNPVADETYYCVSFNAPIPSSDPDYGICITKFYTDTDNVIPGWPVKISVQSECGNEPYITIAEGFTGDDGQFCVSGLVSDTDYVVSETVLSGWDNTNIIVNGMFVIPQSNPFLDAFATTSFSGDSSTTTVDFYNMEEYTPPVYECSDGIDNDDDGYIDYPSDPGCDSPEDNDEYNSYCGDGECNVDETCSTCSSDCGSCQKPEEPKKSGNTMPKLKIVDSGECVVGEDAVATFKYRTNMKGSTLVVCDSKPHLDMGQYEDSVGNSLYYGYPYYTTESNRQFPTDERTIIHEATLELGLGIDTYYCRVISGDNYTGTTDGHVKEEITCNVPEKTVSNVDRSVEPGLIIPDGIVEQKCELLLTDWILPVDDLSWKGHTNDSQEFQDLKDFFNYDLEGKYGTFLESFKSYNYSIGGPLYNAVVKFQEKEASYVLEPWYLKKGTGNVYISTVNRINEIHCNVEIPFSDEEWEVIKKTREGKKNPYKDKTVQDIPPVVLPE